MSLTRNFQTNKTLVAITNENLNVYLNLAQGYEAEFSNLTHKVPNDMGIFELDTLPNPPYVGYLLYSNGKPVGFGLAEIAEEVNDIAEFYIIPSMRKKKMGYHLAAAIFDMYPGSWQVRQISGAEGAKHFWRKVISQYTQNQYAEAEVKDADWGVVTRQQFISKAAKDLNNRETSDAEGLTAIGIFSRVPRNSTLTMQITVHKTSENII